MLRYRGNKFGRFDTHPAGRMHSPGGRFILFSRPQAGDLEHDFGRIASVQDELHNLAVLLSQRQRLRQNHFVEDTGPWPEDPRGRGPDHLEACDGRYHNNPVDLVVTKEGGESALRSDSNTIASFVMAVERNRRPSKV